MTSEQRRRGMTCDMVSLPSARPADLSALLDFVDAFCEQASIDPDDHFDLRLAVEEVCANVMMHGYAGRAPGPLEVTFCAEDELVTISVSDRAGKFDPEHAPPFDLQTPVDERAPGGFGWHLIRRLMDQVRYRYDPEDGNTVTLIKKRHPHVDPAGQSE